MTRYRSYVLGTLLAAMLVSVPACGDDEKDDDDHEEEELEGDCKTISDACHHADEGTGAAHDCHELAHDKDAEACTEQLESCVEACAEHGEH